jgi:hypothetical protein
MKKAPGAALRGLFLADRRRDYMVFGAELLVLGFDVFFALFFVVFFLVVFFAVLFVAGALLVVVGAVLWLLELAPCACAAYGTVDAPTNASRANAEINAFILLLLRFFLRCGQEGIAAPVPISFG